MEEGRIRTSTICVIRHQDRILAAPGYAGSKGVFYRPLGGEINFGEHSRQAIRRELQEEIQVEITDPRYLGVIENFYTLYDVPQHELVIVYEADLVDGSLYGMSSIQGDEGGQAFRVEWVSLTEFTEGRASLFPDGLLDMLV
jgi:ADP-ribose pyrophosphatase YjhB (NUDIX family)